MKNIWSYSSDTHTHTVETHIYRLDKKLKNTLVITNFIKNTTKGYSLKKKKYYCKDLFSKKYQKKVVKPKKGKGSYSRKKFKKV